MLGKAVYEVNILRSIELKWKIKCCKYRELRKYVEVTRLT